MSNVQNRVLISILNQSLSWSFSSLEAAQPSTTCWGRNWESSWISLSPSSQSHSQFQTIISISRFYPRDISWVWPLLYPQYHHPSLSHHPLLPKVLKWPPNRSPVSCLVPWNLFSRAVRGNFIKQTVSLLSLFSVSLSLPTCLSRLVFSPRTLNIGVLGAWS